ncbi:hypothetical protein AM593_00151, partial [Mytilus galloprovincialis]
LQDHVDFLNRGSHKTTKETEEENQRLNAKLEKVRHIFIEWRKSSSGLNNIMAHELDLDDILIESKSKQQQCRQQTDKQNFDSMSSNSISASITSRENISGKEESTTASENMKCCGIISEGQKTMMNETNVLLVRFSTQVSQN